MFDKTLIYAIVEGFVIENLNFQINPSMAELKIYEYKTNVYQID